MGGCYIEIVVHANIRRPGLDDIGHFLQYSSNEWVNWKIDIFSYLL